MSSFGEKLKYLREKNCLKQEDIAIFLKVSRATISKYESGVREPDIDTVKALAQYYNVPVDFIFGLTDFAYPADEVISTMELDNDTIVCETGSNFLLSGFEDVHDFFKDENFLRIARKIKESGLDLGTVENILDNIILLNKGQKHP